MALLLTKTCEYALLVTIQQGRCFAKNSAVKVEAELDLKLPPSINDLIPQNTTISTPAIKSDSDGNCTFNLSLIYYVSWKQLQRLRKLDATTTLHVYENDTLFNLMFSIANAKEVVHQSGHKLDQIHKFVSGEGAWCSIQNATDNQQLKAGLFYVQMPDTNYAISANTPSIQLRSPPPTPSIPKRFTAMSNSSSNRRKKVISILGSCSNSTKSSSSSSTTDRKSTTDKKSTLSSSEKPPLRRAKSSLVDCNMEELSSVLQKMSIFSLPTTTTTTTTTTTATPPPPPPPPEHASYHQIGKGSSQYTFYFKVLYVDHIQLQRQQQTKTQFKKPYIAYTFLTNYTLLPAASFSSSKSNPCTAKSSYQLRGHLVDIQRWLDGQGVICLDYMWMGRFTKETVGQVRVPLGGIAFDGRGMSDKVCHAFKSPGETDEEEEEEEEGEIMASVTVRIGLLSGWHQDDYFIQQEELASKRTLSSSNWDAVMMTSNKKFKHHSQSSIPTLSTTTCSTKSSNVPSIHYIQQSRSMSLTSSKSRPFSLKKREFKNNKLNI